MVCNPLLNNNPSAVNKWFSEVLLCDGFDRKGWKETNIIENWNESRDEKGRVIRALGRID